MFEGEAEGFFVRKPDTPNAARAIQKIIESNCAPAGFGPRLPLLQRASSDVAASHSSDKPTPTG
jgi:hypothetical protein